MTAWLRAGVAFLLGAAGVVTDFFGALDIRHGSMPLGVALGVAGLLAVWGAFLLAGSAGDD